MKKFLLLLALIPSLLFAEDSKHLDMGIPMSIKSVPYHLIIRPQYAANYRPTLGGPEWVAWNLNADWYGDVERYEGNFITDTSLPSGMIRIKHSDYTNSGYDRGHLVRSEERTKTIEDNKSTFILTNIIPQTPELNRNTWLELEYYCEKLCKEQNKELYIYAGGHYPPTPATINNIIAIPDSCFKIIAILERGQTHLDITPSTPIIAVMMPNDFDVKFHPWEDFKTTVRQIENSTGIDFFTALPQSLQDAIEDVKTGVNDNKQTSFKIYPNPATDFLNIEGNTGEVIIYDILGNEVLRSEGSRIDVRGLSNGVYRVNGGVFLKY